jgi:hypothetical protein
MKAASDPYTAGTYVAIVLSFPHVKDVPCLSLANLSGSTPREFSTGCKVSCRYVCRANSSPIASRRASPSSRDKVFHGRLMSFQAISARKLPLLGRIWTSWELTPPRFSVFIAMLAVNRGKRSFSLSTRRHGRFIRVSYMKAEFRSNRTRFPSLSTPPLSQ